MKKAIDHQTAQYSGPLQRRYANLVAVPVIPVKCSHFVNIDSIQLWTVPIYAKMKINH